MNCRSLHIRQVKNTVKSLAVLMMAGCITSGSAVAQELEGYAEPYRSIRVAADETGTIDEVLVREGQFVEAGQPLVRLNSDIYLAILAIAEQKMQAAGRMDAARAELNLRRDRLEKLASLRTEGHARQEEVDRAAAEVEVAEASVRTAHEDAITRRLEYEKIKSQIARRTVHAPIAGVVTVLQRDQGEFVAPNNPDILTLVQIDRLLVNFTLSGPRAADLQLDETVNVQFKDSGESTTGTIEFISPVTDAESGTVLIKVRVDNSRGRFRSGERCRIHVEN